MHGLQGLQGGTGAQHDGWADGCAEEFGDGLLQDPHKASTGSEARGL
jgi:hypothetical protein